MSESKCRFLLTSILDSRISHPPITARPRPIRPAPHYQLSPAATVLAFERHLVLALAKRKRSAANDLEPAGPASDATGLPCFHCCWLLAAVLLLPPTCDNIRSGLVATRHPQSNDTQPRPPHTFFLVHNTRRSDLNPLTIIKEASPFALETCANPSLLQSPRQLLQGPLCLPP